MSDYFVLLPVHLLLAIHKNSRVRYTTIKKTYANLWQLGNIHHGKFQLIPSVKWIHMESIHTRMHVGSSILHFLDFNMRNTFANVNVSFIRSNAIGAILLRCKNIIEFMPSQVGTKWRATHNCQFILYVERTSYVYVCCEQSMCICRCIGKKIYSLSTTCSVRVSISRHLLHSTAHTLSQQTCGRSNASYNCEILNKNENSQFIYNRSPVDSCRVNRILIATRENTKRWLRRRNRLQPTSNTCLVVYLGELHLVFESFQHVSTMWHVMWWFGVREPSRLPLFLWITFSYVNIGRINR